MPTKPTTVSAASAVPVLPSSTVKGLPGETGDEARDRLARLLGNGPKYSPDEARKRRDEALRVVQRDGVPQIVARMRSGDPAVMEQVRRSARVALSGTACRISKTCAQI